MPEDPKGMGLEQAKGAQPVQAAVPKATEPSTSAWDGVIPARLKQSYGGGVQPQSYVGQNFLTIDRTIAHEVLRILRDEFAFDYLVDLTAVHYPKKDLPFEIVWVLYSFSTNERIRVKASFGEGEVVPSVTDLWATANWLEREVFDMFGIRFEGHPDLRRILLPEDWTGHPLRKDYDIRKQDQSWVQKNIGIESAQ